MSRRAAFAVLCLLPLSISAEESPEVERLLERIVLREASLWESLNSTSPVIETYIQEIANSHPAKDHYFLGRFRVGETIAYEPLIERTDPAPPPPPRGRSKASPLQPGPAMTFLPRGFAQMALVDLHDFNRKTYRFEYIRREVLGEVRCFVFDVTPARHSEPGRFLGRIWVEERDNSIVRINGTYVPPPVEKGFAPEYYFHFDSWRVNIAPGQWVPAQIYVEEAGTPSNQGAPRFKAQTRIWGFAAAPRNRLDELTKILIDAESGVKDGTAHPDASPLESQRSWERQAEENILERLEKGGLLAPPGPVDEVLGTVVNNLIASANLPVEAHVRVLLTTPIETFSIGHTIVISRGLIDVLPDEASLALVLADELSHIALGHPTPTQYAFINQTMLGDAQLLQKMHFERSPEELQEAGKKTIEIIRLSPYQKMANAGLFLKALESRGPALPKLLAANLGNQVANASSLSRLAEFTSAAPALEEDKLEQIAALPLGSRVKLNPWNDRIALVQTRPLSLLSPREKMPFEVTPFVLNLIRADSGAQQ